MSTPQTVIVDSHVHLYPAYRLAAALEFLFANLGRIAPHADPAPIRVGVLADTAACRTYRGRLSHPRLKQLDHLILQPTDDPGAMAIRNEERLLGYVMAGRQIVTSEKLEVLALTADPDIPDGTPATEALAAIRAGGALPVLCWSPGKWAGERGRLVRELIENGSPSDFVLGDTTLRPNGWRVPPLLEFGRARGFRVIQGTDPLPFAGEEARLGTCATMACGPWEAAHPAGSLCRLLTDASIPLEPVGRRLSLPGFAVRWTRAMLRKYATKH